jgi:hypothetical protein
MADREMPRVLTVVMSSSVWTGKRRATDTDEARNSRCQPLLPAQMFTVRLQFLATQR